MFTGYQIREKLYESSHSLIFRSIRDKDNEKVVLKVLNKADQALYNAKDSGRNRIVSDFENI